MKIKIFGLYRRFFRKPTDVPGSKYKPNTKLKEVGRNLEAIFSTETSGSLQITRRFNPKDYTHLTYLSETFSSQGHAVA
jgi:hypothetical protein